jgi:large subunit ribosomal protein L10
MERQEKHALVAKLHEEFKGAASVILSHNKGMTVAEVTELRRRSRDNGVTYRVVKNRLAKLALKDTPFDGLIGALKGPTTFAYSDDVVTPAKVVAEFAKTNERLEILGGGIAGQVLDTQGVDALSKMPSLNELRGTLVGMLQAPATKIAQVLQASGAQLARVVNAYANKA